MKHGFIVTPELLHTYGNKDMILMDPLPRVGTIDEAVDLDQRAVFFRSESDGSLYPHGVVSAVAW